MALASDFTPTVLNSFGNLSAQGVNYKYQQHQNSNVKTITRDPENPFAIIFDQYSQTWSK